MSKRKADSGNEKPPNEAKMDVDGQDDDSGSDDVRKAPAEDVIAVQF